MNPLLAEKGSVVESHRQFLGRILSDCLDTLAKGSSTTEEGKKTQESRVHEKMNETISLVLRLLVPRILLNVIDVVLKQIESEYDKNPSMPTAWDIVLPNSSRGKKKNAGFSFMKNCFQLPPQRNF